MKRGCPPLWLLRDTPALAAVFATLWAMIIRIWLVVWRSERRKRPPTDAERASVYRHLAAAESALDYAIARQAYRLLGFSTGNLRPLVFDHPTTREDFNQRYARYLHTHTHMDAAARYTAERLREQYGISRSEAEAVRAAHGATDAARCALAHHEAVGASRFSSNNRSCLALMVSNTRSVRPSKDERVLTNARGPPTPIADCLFPTAHHLSAQRA